MKVVIDAGYTEQYFCTTLGKWLDELITAQSYLPELLESHTFYRLKLDIIECYLELLQLPDAGTISTTPHRP